MVGSTTQFELLISSQPSTASVFSAVPYAEIIPGATPTLHSVEVAPVRRLCSIPIVRIAADLLRLHANWQGARGSAVQETAGKPRPKTDVSATSQVAFAIAGLSARLLPLVRSKLLSHAAE